MKLLKGQSKQLEKATKALLRADMRLIKMQRKVCQLQLRGESAKEYLPFMNDLGLVVDNLRSEVKEILFKSGELTSG